MPANPSGCCPQCCPQMAECPYLTCDLVSIGCAGLIGASPDPNCEYELDGLGGCVDLNIMGHVEINADGCAGQVDGRFDGCGSWTQIGFVVNSCDPIDIDFSVICSDTGAIVNGIITV